jgi:tetratricopeptide (TPR) repeat protein
MPDQELDEGIRILESCLGDKTWEVNWLLGKAYEAKGSYVESARQFSQAFQIEPKHASVVHELIIALLRINEQRKAHIIASHYLSRNDPLLNFDMVLSKSMIPEEHKRAIELLDELSWPIEFTGRVSSLRERLTDATAGQ